jgi:hypothetical protein
VAGVSPAVKRRDTLPLPRLPHRRPTATRILSRQRMTQLPSTDIRPSREMSICRAADGNQSPNPSIDCRCGQVHATGCALMATRNRQVSSMTARSGSSKRKFSAMRQRVLRKRTRPLCDRALSARRGSSKRLPRMAASRDCTQGQAGGQRPGSTVAWRSGSWRSGSWR